VIDTHSHLLPGLDDGADDLVQSQIMAHLAEDEGVTDVVCTPHVDSPTAPVLREGPSVLAAAQSACMEAGLALRLHLGHELSFPFVQTTPWEELGNFAFGPTYKALLVEAPYVGWPAFADDVFYRLRLHGFTPLLAHPERNPLVQARRELLPSLIKLGVVPQGTIPSLLGVFGAATRKTLLSHLAEGNIWLLASDMHYERRAESGMAQGRAALERLLPGLDTELLFEENPARLLRGEPLCAPRPLSGGRAWSRVKAVVGRIGGAGISARRRT
jgi:protein-tyrosine phosphatase